MIIPKPQSETYADGAYMLPAHPQFFLPAHFAPVRDGVAALLPAFSGTEQAADADVRFALDGALAEEAYSLCCDGNGITVAAHDGPAAVHAAATLMQLMRSTSMLRVPYCRIDDAPRFSWRGQHIDVARHFFPMETLQKLVDCMAIYKLNRLHFHFSDDQGYRIESESLPALHETGSRRESSAVKRGEGEKQDGVPHSGYYTKDEVRGLIRYAAARGIEVIPEIDLPGHTNALIASYPFLCCFPAAAKVVTEYGLRPFMHTILCAGEPRVYEFLFTLFDEITALFPSEYVHIGGDEAGKNNWRKCPKCHRVMQEQGIGSLRDLQGYMLARVQAHLQQKGKRVIIWNDAINRFTTADAIVQHWTPKSVEGDRRTAAHVNSGGQAIMSGFRYLYLDYPYAMTPVRKVYEYTPMPKGVLPENRSNIIGCESALWTEWIADEKKLFFNLLPRLAAASELFWSTEANRDYADFLRRLQPHYALYADLGLPYAKDMERAGNVLRRLRIVHAFFRKDAYTELR